MTELFRSLKKVVEERRSIKPHSMDGRLVPDEAIKALLQLADWAPTHGHTEPWRFVVYGPEKVSAFCLAHAELYKQHTDPAAFSEAGYDKIIRNGDKASHIIAVLMKRGNAPKIRAWEEIAATAAAVQNILLGAQSLGITAFWSTGGMVHHPALKAYFELGGEDMVMGLLFLGYTTETKEGKRRIPLTEKVSWPI